MAQVRYIVDDVDAAVEFYVFKLGFELQQQFGPAPASAFRPMLDGTVPSPGGWSRFVLTFDDLESDVAQLRDDGVEFKNDIVEQGGRKQILCVDPSGNVVELFQAE